MVLLSHPTGNTFVRALLHGLDVDRQLGVFATTLGFCGEPEWARILPKGISAELHRRSYRVPARRFRTLAWREAVRLASQRLGWKNPVRHETGWASVDAVYRALDHHVAHHLPVWKREFGLTTAYAYEDSALETLQAARREGMTAVYDLPIAYWETSRRLLEEEARRLPAWEQTLVGTSDSSAKLARKTKEIETSDVVICPSQFVLESIPAEIRTSKRCVVAEFGSPADSGVRATPRQSNEKLRVLFAGSMTQRKGLGDLFAAMKSLQGGQVELVVLGSPIANMDFYRSEYSDFIYEPPRPHEAVLGLMASCHVLCLPSIVEGRALVQQEAMSIGLPIIVTRNAGGEDLVEDGRTGFLVPPGRPDLIAQRIEWFLSNPEQWTRMSAAASQKAAQFSWERYSLLVLKYINESKSHA